jgi:hypothetical protein
MSSDSSSSRLKPIGGALALQEIIGSVRQLSYMKQHSEILGSTLNVKLEMTYASAPVGRLARGQTYELERIERRDPSVGERMLEKSIWKKCGFQAVAAQGHPVFGDVCRFIQTYQMPLQGTRGDKRWGKIDLVGVTSDALPVVIELKREDAKDSLLRMLVEGVAYACAVRKAWNEGGLRAKWAVAMKKHGLHQEQKEILANVPVLLLAPSGFWKRAIGSKGTRSNGKVREDAWPPFMKLVHKCSDHGFPIHFLEFKLEHAAEPDASKRLHVSPVHLPVSDDKSQTGDTDPVELSQP